MIQFEDVIFNGPLSQYLENCKKHRIESIYNIEYRYIKEIIWDDEANNKFGNDRTGYEKFKNDFNYPGDLTYSGLVDLRVRIDKEGNALGYITETKLTYNESYNIMYSQYSQAKEKLYEILEIKNRETFDYWFNNYSYVNLKSGNDIIYSIKSLEEIIVKYNEEEEFKKFIDAIKEK